MTSPVIAVVGAGAAGLMAAIHAAGPGRRVVLVERTPDGGRKILISGGGRCNVLPSALDPSRYVTASSPNTMRNLLRSWPLEAQRRYFEDDLGLPLVREEETGKLFPVANRARAVRDALVRHATNRGVTLMMATEVTGLAPAGVRWQVARRGMPPLAADAVVLATGGLSVPQTGSDGFAYRALAPLGHVLHDTYPALTPLTLAPPRFADLAGVSLRATVTARSAAERVQSTGGFLFTHRGYSGPTVLDVSHVSIRAAMAGADATVSVQWGPHDGAAWEHLLAPAATHVATVLRQELPARLADRLLIEARVDGGTPLAQLTRDARRRVVAALTAFPLPVTGDEGYRKAEVTGGGIALSDVDPRTLESRRQPGLFLAGELLDAFGPIGGYNFAWAWATGRLAGLGAAARVTPRQ